MRTYSYLSSENKKTVLSLLDRIIEPTISVSDYRMAFLELGEELGAVIGSDLLEVPESEIMFTFASEDSDWLGKGVLTGSHKEKAPISVFWNNRDVAFQDEHRKIEVSSIVKSYEEEASGCRYLVVIKSIINTSCVVQTQLMRMIGKFNPDKIYVVAPVMYKDAEKSLEQEFPREVSSKFSYVYFAMDDEREGNTVIPGVGGQVYSRLGLEDIDEKNSYIPEIVRERLRMV